MTLSSFSEFSSILHAFRDDQGNYGDVPNITSTHEICSGATCSMFAYASLAQDPVSAHCVFKLGNAITIQVRVEFARVCLRLEAKTRWNS